MLSDNCLQCAVLEAYRDDQMKPQARRVPTHDVILIEESARGAAPHRWGSRAGSGNETLLLGAATAIADEMLAGALSRLIPPCLVLQHRHQ